MQSAKNTAIPELLINPDTDIATSYETWRKFQNTDIDILSEPIKAGIDVVLLYLANPRNEYWYPSTKSSIKMIVNDTFKTEPPLIEELALYEASQGQKWKLVSNTFLYNESYYDYVVIDENKFLLRLIASPNDKNDITWVVFYQLGNTENGVVIRMEVFFIGFPKFGIRNAPKFVRKLLRFIFTPLLLEGFNKKLKKDAEAIASSKLSIHPS